jgi:hypothetical protein
VPQGSLLRTLKCKSVGFLGSHFAYPFVVLPLEQPWNLGSPSFCAQVRRKLMSMHVDKELRGNEKSGVVGKGELLGRLHSISNRLHALQKCCGMGPCCLVCSRRLARGPCNHIVFGFIICSQLRLQVSPSPSPSTALMRYISTRLAALSRHVNTSFRSSSCVVAARRISKDSTPAPLATRPRLSR